VESPFSWRVQADYLRMNLFGTHQNMIRASTESWSASDGSSLGLGLNLATYAFVLGGFQELRLVVGFRELRICLALFSVDFLIVRAFLELVDANPIFPNGDVGQPESIQRRSYSSESHPVRDA